ncbi:hypothetical protein BH23ACT9_BH23ACT9_30350 [soil metagenome]
MIGDSIAGQARIPHHLRAILLDALAVREQHLTGEALDVAVAALDARIEKFCASQPTHQPNRKLVKHVANVREHLLTFLTTPGVQATNWRAEQAIRPAVVNRKNWGGNATRQGADTTQVIASVLRTAHQQHLDLIAVLAHIQTTGLAAHRPEVGPLPVSPSLTPQQPGTRYKIVLAKLNPDGTTPLTGSTSRATPTSSRSQTTPPPNSTPTSTSPATPPPAYASSATSPTSSTRPLSANPLLRAFSQTKPRRRCRTAPRAAT